MREEDAVRALETLGLTGKEAAAYLNLQRSGASSAQQVSQLLGVQYPAVYRILQSLQSKGWIDISQERPNRYRARTCGSTREPNRLVGSCERWSSQATARSSA